MTASGDVFFAANTIVMETSIGRYWCQSVANFLLNFINIHIESQMTSKFLCISLDAGDLFTVSGWSFIM
jgi:hypothetical protein